VQNFADSGDRVVEGVGLLFTNWQKKSW